MRYDCNPLVLVVIRSYYKQNLIEYDDTNLYTVLVVPKAAFNRGGLSRHHQAITMVMFDQMRCTDYTAIYWTI